MSIDLQKAFSALSPEDQAAAMQIKSPEDLVSFASARGLSITGDDVKALFVGNAEKGELTPEELGNVAGGFTCDKAIPLLCKSGAFDLRCYFPAYCDHFTIETAGRYDDCSDAVYATCNSGNFYRNKAILDRTLKIITPFEWTLTN